MRNRVHVAFAIATEAVESPTTRTTHLEDAYISASPNIPKKPRRMVAKKEAATCDTKRDLLAFWPFFFPLKLIFMLSMTTGRRNTTASNIEEHHHGGDCAIACLTLAKLRLKSR